MFQMVIVFSLFTLAFKSLSLSFFPQRVNYDFYCLHMLTEDFTPTSKVIASSPTFSRPSYNF